MINTYKIDGKKRKIQEIQEIEREYFERMEEEENLQKTLVRKSFLRACQEFSKKTRKEGFVKEIGKRSIYNENGEIDPNKFIDFLYIIWDQDRIELSNFTMKAEEIFFKIVDIINYGKDMVIDLTHLFIKYCTDFFSKNIFEDTVCLFMYSCFCIPRLIMFNCLDISFYMKTNSYKRLFYVCDMLSVSGPKEKYDATKYLLKNNEYATKILMKSSYYKSLPTLPENLKKDLRYCWTIFLDFYKESMVNYKCIMNVLPGLTDEEKRVNPRGLFLVDQYLKHKNEYKIAQM